MQNGDETAYLCRPNHPQTLKCLAMDSLGQTVNAKESHLNLQISVEHKVKITYLGHTITMQSVWWPGNRIGWSGSHAAECESHRECQQRTEVYG